MGREYFLLEKDKKGIARITFNRPEKLNVLEMEDMEAFYPLLREVEEDDDVKVVIFKGAGECFGAGANVMVLGTETVGFSRDPKAPHPTVRARLLRERKLYHDVHEKVGMGSLFHFGKPCITQVHGYCYGWHFQIMTASDISIISEESLFTHPAFRYINESNPMMVWIDMMGYKRAAEMMLTGRAFNAEEMRLCGMANKVVPRDKLEETANEYAEIIAMQPKDVLVVDKHYLETMRGIRNDTFGPSMVACFGHLAATYMKLDPGDFAILKETTKKGAGGAIDERERRYPPAWRLSYKGRAAKE